MIPVIMLESIKQIYLFSIIEHFLPDQLHYTDYVDEKKIYCFKKDTWSHCHTIDFKTMINNLKLHQLYKRY